LTGEKIMSSCNTWDWSQEEPREELPETEEEREERERRQKADRERNEREYEAKVAEDLKKYEEMQMRLDSCSLASASSDTEIRENAKQILLEIYGWHAKTCDGDKAGFRDIRPLIASALVTACRIDLSQSIGGKKRENARQILREIYNCLYVSPKWQDLRTEAGKALGYTSIRIWLHNLSFES
jgi:hypothetical protein